MRRKGNLALVQCFKCGSTEFKEFIEFAPYYYLVCLNCGYKTRVEEQPSD